MAVTLLIKRKVTHGNESLLEDLYPLIQVKLIAEKI